MSPSFLRTQESKSPMPFSLLRSSIPQSPPLSDPGAQDQTPSLQGPRNSYSFFFFSFF